MQAGISNAALASVGVQVMNVLMTVVAASLMDRAGRKQLLTISFRCGSVYLSSPHDLLCVAREPPSTAFGGSKAPCRDWRGQALHPTEPVLAEEEACTLRCKRGSDSKMAPSRTPRLSRALTPLRL